jgi:tRNA pseudouridine55 synthase
VTVYRFEELWRDGDRVGLEVECSAGTYIRQLVADLGDAYCESLERTAIGDFKLDNADPERIVPLEDALGFMPAFELDADEARRAGDGGRVAGDATEFTRLMHDGRLVAIAEPADGMLKPRVVIPS